MTIEELAHARKQGAKEPLSYALRSVVVCCGISALVWMAVTAEPSPQAAAKPKPQNSYAAVASKPTPTAIEIYAIEFAAFVIATLETKVDCDFDYRSCARSVDAAARKLHRGIEWIDANPAPDCVHTDPVRQALQKIYDVQVYAVRIMDQGGRLDRATAELGQATSGYAAAADVFIKEVHACNATTKENK